MNDRKAPSTEKHKTPSAKPSPEQHRDLDDALDDSFPASDPPSMTQPRTRTGSPPDRKTDEESPDKK